MTADGAVILETLTALALEQGYKPVGKVYFYKEHPEVICVLNLQKSAWGPQHYLNAGVALMRLSKARRPKLSGLHIQWRADSLAEQRDDSPLHQALDLENSMTDSVRHQSIRDEVSRHAFAHLAKCTTEANSIDVARRINAAIKQVVFAPKESVYVVTH